mmetsp:Transcript_5295/g.11629  ORF Transcript_5295/g.11629 Transcript_5295/m.11629 type:complete len:320 (-) Transcript_5295:316-1275(-)
MDTLTILMAERQALAPFQSQVPNTITLLDQTILQMMLARQQGNSATAGSLAPAPACASIELGGLGPSDAAAAAASASAAAALGLQDPGAAMAASNASFAAATAACNPLMQPQASLLQSNALMQMGCGLYGACGLGDLGASMQQAMTPASQGNPKVFNDALETGGTAMVSQLGSLTGSESLGQTTGKGRGGTHRWMVPVENHPGFNLTGRIVGPKGSTLRGLQTTYNVRLFVRGKGSEKPGAPKRSYTGDNVEEPLHVNIEGGADGDVDGCIAALEALCAPVTDPQNDVIRQEQMNTQRNAHELAKRAATTMPGLGDGLY